jgi:hypothetical protein
MMDNSTVAGDNVSVFSVPYKDSRPSTPSQVPPYPPRLPGYTSRNESPLRTGSPIGRPDDYFNRPPTRGPYAMTPGYSSEEGFELNPIGQQNYDPREMSDVNPLLDHHGRPRSRDPTPSRRGYM